MASSAKRDSYSVLQQFFNGLRGFVESSDSLLYSVDLTDQEAQDALQKSNKDFLVRSSATLGMIIITSRDLSGKSTDLSKFNSQFYWNKGTGSSLVPPEVSSNEELLKIPKVQQALCDHLYILSVTKENLLCPTAAGLKKYVDYLAERQNKRKSITKPATTLPAEGKKESVQVSSDGLPPRPAPATRTRSSQSAEEQRVKGQPVPIPMTPLTRSRSLK